MTDARKRCRTHRLGRESGIDGDDVANRADQSLRLCNRGRKNPKDGHIVKPVPLNFKIDNHRECDKIYR